MDHQKLNNLLIFGTFSFGGCGGQGCYFWPNPRVISKNSAIQDDQNTFKPKLACIFLPARAKWNITVCVGTPCTCWFLAKNISDFVSLPWKLHNRYCHNSPYSERVEPWFFFKKRNNIPWKFGIRQNKRWSETAKNFQLVFKSYSLFHLNDHGEDSVENFLDSGVLHTPPFCMLAVRS